MPNRFPSEISRVGARQGNSTAAGAEYPGPTGLPLRGLAISWPQRETPPRPAKVGGAECGSPRLIGRVSSDGRAG